MKIFEITAPQTIDLSGLTSYLKGKQSRATIAQIVTDFVETELDEEIEISIDTNENVSKGSMSIGAFYSPDRDEEYDVAVEIILVFNPGDKVIEWDKAGATEFAHELSDAVKHEFLHASQYRGRNFHPGKKGRIRTNQATEYMSRDDEIEAYALNIADELVRKLDKDGALQVLRMARKTAQFEPKVGPLLSPNLRAFFSMFDWDASNPVIKRLLKKTYQFIIK